MLKSTTILLLTVFIALVAMTTADWTLSFPSGQTITAGQAFNFELTTSSAITPKSNSPEIETSAKFISLDGFSASEIIWCTAAAAANAAYYQLDQDKISLTFVADIAKDAKITCPARAQPNFSGAKNSFKIDGTDSADFPISALATDVSFSISGGKSLSINFKNVPANTLYGPFTLHVATNSALTSNNFDITDEVLQRELLNSDFSANIGSGYRLWSADDDEFWVLTNDSPGSSASFTINLVDASSLSYKKEAVGSNIWYGVKFNDGSPQQVQGDVIPVPQQTLQVDTEVDSLADIVYSASIFNNLKAAPVVTLNFDTDYTLDEIFAATSSLKYQINNDVTKVLDISTKATEYTLTDAAVGDRISIDGIFKFTDVKQFTVAFTINDSTVSSKLIARVGVTDLKITSVTGDLASFNFKLAVDSLYKKLPGAIEYDTGLFFKYSSDDAEIRKNGKYLPSCTLDGGDSTEKTFTGSNVDADRHYLAISGSLSSSDKTIAFQCEQQLRGGKFADKKFKIAVNIMRQKDDQSQSIDATWDVLDLIDDKDNFKQRVNVYGASITSKSSFDSFLATIAAQFPDLVGDIHFVVSRASPQSPSDANFGLKADFDNGLPYLLQNGAYISVVFNLKDGTTAQDAIWLKDGVEYHAISAVSTVQAYPTAAVYLNGNDDVVYGANSQVVYGNGSPCWSTQQCVDGSYCYGQICTAFAGLSKAAQTSLNDDDSTSSSIIASAFFAVIIAAVAVMF